MKIALVSNCSPNDVLPPSQGAVEQLVWDLHNALAARGNQVQVFCSRAKIPNAVEIGLEKLKPPQLQSFASMLKCFPASKKLDAEVVHCHHPLSALPFLGKAPLVYTEHNWYNLPGMDFHRTPFTRVFDLAQKKVYAKADAVIALSSEMKKVMEKKVAKEKIHLIPNYVDTSTFKPGKKNSKRILFAARLDKEKNPLMLLQALEGMKDFGLKVAGSGPLEKQLKTFAEEKKLNAKFLGAVKHSELAKEFSAAGIFVLPSKFEVMPLAVLEAMSSGCAVIAGNAFGIKDQLDEGVNGFVLKENSAENLREKISLLLSDSKLQKKLGSSARKKVLKEFDVNVVSKKLENLYRSLAEGV